MRDALRTIHRRITRRQFRAAPKARTKARLLGFLRTIEKLAVDLLGWLHRANWPAVNTRRRDAYEKDAIEPPVAGDKRFVKTFGCLHHGGNIAPNPSSA